MNLALKSMQPLETEHLKRDLKVKEKENIEIRDNLAIERTQFANERTFLAYVRTGMGLVLAGFSLVQFFHDQVFVWIGVFFVPVGIFVGIIGLKKFLTKRECIDTHRANYTPTSPMHKQVVAEEKRQAENATAG